MRLSDFLADFPDQDVEIGQELSKVAALAHQYDRAGKVVITLNVARVNTRVQVTVGSKTTEPSTDPELGLFHIDRDGSLTKNDPDQMFDRATGEITPRAKS